MGDVWCAKGSYAKVLKEVAHVVEHVVTLKNHALVVQIVWMFRFVVIVVGELKKSGLRQHIVRFVHMMNTVQGLSIKLVNLAHFAVANAKSSSKIVSAAKDVANLLAFAALVVAIYASSANAGVQKSFRILFDVQ